MPTAHVFLIVTIVGLAGCGEIPQIGTQADAARDAPFPELVRLDTLLNAAGATPTRITTASIATTNDRITRLRARAAALRGPVVDAATRSQMRAASARAALR